MLTSIDVCEELSVVAERAEYIDDLWFLLHHSESKDNLVLGLTSYLDDSGSHDGSGVVTIGGPVVSRIQFKAFSGRWDKLLKKYHVDHPLKMADFVRPHGRYCGWLPEIKMSLFYDISALVNSHKLYSISVAIEGPMFESALNAEVRRSLIGPYAFAFFGAVLLNQSIAQHVTTVSMSRLSYLVDTGFRHQDQLSEAHAVLINSEKRSGATRLTGALAFDSDDRVPALQAADIIAWASRKRQLDGALCKELGPLNELLRSDVKRPHGHLPLPFGAIKMLAGPIRNWISENGKLPILEDIIRP